MIQKQVDWRIRSATSAADIANVACLFREYQQWLNVDLCFQSFEAELTSLPGKYAPPTGALLLAESGNEAVGCVGVRAIDAGIAEMKRLYVRAPQRGSGLGRALAVASIEAAIGNGNRLMRLDTLSRLREAMALYASLGFTQCAPYYDNPLGEVVFWELDLAAFEA